MSTSWCNLIWCGCEPCSNFTILEPCLCLTTQGITDSESPPTSNMKIEDALTCSVESIVGAVITGALLGSVVMATVFVCIHRRFSFCPRQKKEHNPVFRMHEGLIQESPEETGQDNPVYDDIPDETQKGHSSPSIHPPEDSERKEHFHQTATPNTRCSDEYDHTGPEIIVNNGLNMEKVESLQTQQHQGKSEKENDPESPELDRNVSEDYDYTGSAKVITDVHDMLSTDGQNEETFFKADPNLLPESRNSGNIQISQYFSLEAQ